MQCYQDTVPSTGLYREILPNISFILCNIFFMTPKTIGDIKCSLRIVKNSIAIINETILSSLYYRIMKENSTCNFVTCKTNINNTFSLMTKHLVGGKEEKEREGIIYIIFLIFSSDAGALQSLYSRFTVALQSLFCHRSRLSSFLHIYVKSLRYI